MPRQVSFAPGRRGRLLRVLISGGVLLSLAGCQSMGTNGPASTGSLGDGVTLSPSDLSGDQALAAVQKWGDAYSKDGKNKTAAINFAAALRAAGETGQSVAVMRKATIYHATDRDVLAGFGKALAADGQFQEALQTIRRAQRRDNPDWQLLSAEGGILDSVGDHDGARALYRQAMVLAPGEPQVLNNLGMSYVLTGDLDQAEQTLRQAAASSKATQRVHQNLDLVMKLKARGGKPPELASNDVTAAEVSAETEFFDETVEQPDTWKEIEKAG